MSKMGTVVAWVVAGMLAGVAHGAAMRDGVALDDLQLDAAIAGLEDPGKRYENAAKIVKFYWSYPHSTGGIWMTYGSAELDARVRRAGQALGTFSNDLEIVTEAMGDPDRTMRWWAIGAAGSLISDPINGKSRPEGDAALLPMVRSMVDSDDDGLRGRAEEVLRYVPSERALLEKVRERETSPTNIMRMVTSYPKEVYSADMNRHLLRLLGSADAKVQSNALLFVATNSGMAEIFHCTFDDQVKARVVELSKVPAHREVAGGALMAIYAFDPKAVLTHMDILVRDPDREIRRGAAWMMSMKREEKEVRAVLERMIADPDERVRMDVISILGEGAKYRGELEVLARSKDGDVARDAEAVLKSLEGVGR